MDELLDDLEAVEVGAHAQGGRRSGRSATRTRARAPPVPISTASGRVTVGLGQPQDAIPGRRKLVPMLIGGVLLLAIGGGAAALLGGRDQEQPQHVVKPATDAPAKPEAPPQPAAPEPTPPAAPAAAAAEVTIRSEPIGAEVYRNNDLVGNTPYTLQKPQGAERVEFELRLGGYENRSFAITAVDARRAQPHARGRQAVVAASGLRAPSRATAGGREAGATQDRQAAPRRRHRSSRPLGLARDSRAAARELPPCRARS